jgi:hypothetical protein
MFFSLANTKKQSAEFTMAASLLTRIELQAAAIFSFCTFGDKHGAFLGPFGKWPSKMSNMM